MEAKRDRRALKDAKRMAQLAIWVARKKAKEDREREERDRRGGNGGPGGPSGSAGGISAQ